VLKGVITVEGNVEEAHKFALPKVPNIADVDLPFRLVESCAPHSFGHLVLIDLDSVDDERKRMNPVTSSVRSVDVTSEFGVKFVYLRLINQGKLKGLYTVENNKLHLTRDSSVLLTFA
jgi:hypothetical protein